jgi:predicted nuclease with RNAse H fold
METLRLAGIDVGFSAVRDSTGLAFLDGETLTVAKATSDVEDRRAKTPAGFRPTVAAFDGPIAPSETVKRKCEYTFSKMPFNKRCKPGLSHRFCVGGDCLL